MYLEQDSRFRYTIISSIICRWSHGRKSHVIPIFSISLPMNKIENYHVKLGSLGYSTKASHFKERKRINITLKRAKIQVFPSIQVYCIIRKPKKSITERIPIATRNLRNISAFWTGFLFLCRSNSSNKFPFRLTVRLSTLPHFLFTDRGRRRRRRSGGEERRTAWTRSSSFIRECTHDMARCREPIFLTLAPIKNNERETKRRFQMPKRSAQPVSPNANALTKKAAWNPESIADGGCTDGQTDADTAGREDTVRASQDDVNAADDETRENPCSFYLHAAEYGN